MLIKRDILEKIRSGEITLQFRRWTRRTVKPGGTLKTAVGVLGIGAITRTQADDVTDADARRAGFSDAADFRKWLGTMKPGELDRIEVSYVGEDPRRASTGRRSDGGRVGGHRDDVGGHGQAYARRALDSEGDGTDRSISRATG
jgi:hypothetical protein